MGPQHQPPLAPTLMAEPPGGGLSGGLPGATLAQPMPPNMYQPISQNNPMMNNFVNYPPAHTQPPPGNYCDSYMFLPMGRIVLF